MFLTLDDVLDFEWWPWLYVSLQHLPPTIFVGPLPPSLKIYQFLQICILKWHFQTWLLKLRVTFNISFKLTFHLKMDMSSLTSIFFTFNWLTLTSEMHFVKFHPKIASCLLSRGKRKYAPLGMRLLWKYIINYFLVYHLTSQFLLYLQNYKEFKAEILDLQLKNMGFHLI